MPTRDRKCSGCGAMYEVLVLGSMAEIHPIDPGAAVRTDGKIRCTRCGSAEYTDVFNTSFTPVGLGGEAGVGRFYPYRDRALGPGPDGMGIEVRDAKHREWLMTHTPSGRVREERLIPLDTTSDSGLRGTWTDAVDYDAANNEEIDRDYSEMMDELTATNAEAVAKVQEHAATLIPGSTDA